MSEKTNVESIFYTPELSRYIDSQWTRLGRQTAPLPHCQVDWLLRYLHTCAKRSRSRGAAASASSSPASPPSSSPSFIFALSASVLLVSAFWKARSRGDIQLMARCTSCPTFFCRQPWCAIQPVLTSLTSSRDWKTSLIYNSQQAWITKLRASMKATRKSKCLTDLFLAVCVVGDVSWIIARFVAGLAAAAVVAFIAATDD